MDGSTIHWKKKRSIHSVVSKRRIRERLHDFRDVSANADELKACVDRSFNLIKEHCAWTTMC